jgi:hypothetical protein
MENPTTTQPVIPNEPQDERAEWITPAITDYDIEEATLSNLFISQVNTDGGIYPTSYS